MRPVLLDSPGFLSPLQPIVVRVAQHDPRPGELLSFARRRRLLSSEPSDAEPPAHPRALIVRFFSNCCLNCLDTIYARGCVPQAPLLSQKRRSRSARLGSSNLFGFAALFPLPAPPQTHIAYRRASFEQVHLTSVMSCASLGLGREHRARVEGSDFLASTDPQQPGMAYQQGGYYPQQQQVSHANSRLRSPLAGSKRPVPRAVLGIEKLATWFDERPEGC